MYYAMVVSPVELEGITKTCYVGQTIVLDGSLGDLLGQLMHELAVRNFAVALAEEPLDTRVSLWPFEAKEIL